MAEVKVLLEGFHEVQEDGLKIACTSTLIKSDINILVDPGHYSQEEELLEVLQENNLSPDDIDVVFLTHVHLDHAANAHLFKKAKIYLKHQQDYVGQFHLPQEGKVIRIEIKDGIKLAKDVEFLLAPGHSGDMTALKVNTEEGIVVVAGDAIATESLADISKKPLLFTNLEDFEASRRKILKIADFIVLGHGKMIKNNKY